MIRHAQSRRAWIQPALGRVQGRTDVSSLAGRPVHPRFVLRDANLHTLQFHPGV